MTTTRLQPTHKTLTVNGLRIHDLEWGAANARATRRTSWSNR
jgi:hypothetical protein